MKKIHSAVLRWALILTACVLATACSTTIDVKPYAGVGTKGLRYTLPEPYLLVRPKPDGTADYDWVFLPNKDNEYAIEASSFLSTYKLDISMTTGFLTQVNLSGTSTAVASKLAEVAGDVNAAKKDAQVALEKAADKAATDKAVAEEKASNDKLIAAEKAVADAKSLEIAAHAEVEFYSTPAGSSATPAAVLAAKLALAKAIAAVQEMERRRDDLVVSNAGAKDSPSADSLKRVLGPVLFRLVQKDGRVELRAVNKQGNFESSSAASKTTAKADEVALTMTKVSSGGSITTVAFDVSIAGTSVGDGQVGIVKDTKAFTASKAVITKSSGGDKTYDIAFNPKLPTGEYAVQVSLKGGDGKEFQSLLLFSIK